MASTEVTFSKKPYGFVYGPSEDGKSITIKFIKKGSAASKKGLAAGMRLTNLNGICVKDKEPEIVRELLKTSDSKGLLLKFEHPVPDLKLPAMYHVKHPIVEIAA